MKLKTEHGLTLCNGHGCISIKDDMHGDDAWHGRLTIEYDTENVSTIMLTPSELIELRDFLNRLPLCEK